MQTRRRFLGAAALGLLGGALPFATRAQGVDTAKILVGFPPGGTTDVMARKVADKLRGAYARSAIVENRPGAGGQLGVVALKDAPPDGATLLLTPSSMLTIYPNTYPKLQYRVEDVAPVSLAMYSHHVLSVGPAVPDSVKTLKDFFAWAKANPDKAVYGSPGAGSMPHLIGVLLDKAAGANLRHAGYRGSAPGIQDLLGGQIASFLGPTGDVLAHSQAGKVRVLGTSGKERSVFLPAVPTMGEQGFKIALRECTRSSCRRARAPRPCSALPPRCRRCSGRPRWWSSRSSSAWKSSIPPRGSSPTCSRRTPPSGADS